MKTSGELDRPVDWEDRVVTEDCRLRFCSRPLGSSKVKLAIELEAEDMLETEPRRQDGLASVLAILSSCSDRVGQHTVTVRVQVRGYRAFSLIDPS